MNIEDMKYKPVNDIMILVLYIIASPIMFSKIYPLRVTGDGGMIYVAVVFAAALTAIILILTFWRLNKKLRSKWKPLIKGIISIALSNLIFFIWFHDGHSEFKQTFFISNNIVLAIVYLLSFATTYLKQHESTTDAKNP